MISRLLTCQEDQVKDHQRDQLEGGLGVTDIILSLKIGEQALFVLMNLLANKSIIIWPHSIQQLDIRICILNAYQIIKFGAVFDIYVLPLVNEIFLFPKSSLAAISM